MSAPATPPPPQPAETKKKGISTVGWVLIGCLGLLMLVGGCFAYGTFFVAKKAKNVLEGVAGDFEDNPALAAAEMIVKLNPDLELVDSDPDEGTLTIRDKESGEVVSIDYRDLEKGKLSFDTGEGEVTIGMTGLSGDEDEPVGIVVDAGKEGDYSYGAAAPEDLPDLFSPYPGSEVSGNFASSTPEMSLGSVTMTTTDSVTDVIEFYADDLEDRGFEVSRSTMSGPTGEGGTLQGEKSEPERTVSIIISSDGSDTQIMVNYSAAKE